MAADPPSPEPLPPPPVPVSFWQRTMDWLFGRDFFISYRWTDARPYAVALAEKLKRERFDCFLDSDGFLKGDNWPRIGERELRKTSRLILLGSPQVHLSTAVAQELEIFRAKKGRMIAIEFGDSLSGEHYPGSAVVARLDPDAIRQREPIGALACDPSEEVIAELRRTFTGETAARRRLRAVQATSAVLLVLFLLSVMAAGVAHWQYRSNLVASALADSQRAGVDVEGINQGRALGYWLRSVAKNPGDSSVASALMRFAVENPPVPLERIAGGSFRQMECSRDGGVVVMLREDGKVLARLRGNQEVLRELRFPDVERIALSPDGRWLGLAAGGRVGVLPMSGDLPPEPPWHACRAGVTALAVSEVGALIHGDGEGQVWLLAPLSATPETLGEPFASGVSQVAFMGEQLLAGAAAEDGSISVWDRGKMPVPMESSTVMLPVFTRAGRLWFADFDPGELEGESESSGVACYGYHPGNGGDQQPGMIFSKGSPRWPRSSVRSLVADDAGRNCVALLNVQEVMLTGMLPDRDARVVIPGVTAVALSGAGNTLVTSHIDGSLNRWQGEQLTPLRSLGYAPPGVASMLAGDDGSLVHLRHEGGVSTASFSRGMTGVDPSLTPSVVKAVLPQGFRPLSHHAEHRRARHGGSIRREATSADEQGRWKISGDRRGTVRITHPMSPADADEWQSVWEGSHSAVMPGTLAAISGDGRRVATAAGRSVKIWRAHDGRSLCGIKIPREHYPFMLRLAADGGTLLVGFRERSGQLQGYQLYETLTGNPLGRWMQLYSAEMLEDVSPDLKRVLIRTPESVQARDAESGRGLAEPVSINSVVWRASFVAEGSGFLLAARDGRFRVWRTEDSMPMCAIGRFHPEAPHYSGEPDDSYGFSVWEETVSGQPRTLRRLAFGIDNTGLDEVPPAGFRVFDLGMDASPADSRLFAALLADAYGIHLDESGSLIRMAPAGPGILKSTYLEDGIWATKDMERVAAWLLRGRLAGQPVPLSGSD